MSDDHIGVKVNGVLYVKLEDARKLREGWDEADKHIEEWRDAANEALRKCGVWQVSIQEGEKPKDVLQRLIHFLISTTHDQETSEHIEDMIHAARREGMEEAAKIAWDYAIRLDDMAELSRYPHVKREHEGRSWVAQSIAAAIRAAAKEVKP